MEFPPSNIEHEDRYLRWIAWLNVCKGVLLCLLALGLLGFLHRDIDAIVGNWLSLLGMNMENRHIVKLLARLDHVTDKQVAEWSGITFAVAGVFLTEGAGLLLRQEWAKYLTIGVTASFVPLEIVESIKHFGWLKLGLMVVNIAVVAFLVVSLLREKRRPRQALPAVSTQPPATVAGCEAVGTPGS